MTATQAALQLQIQNYRSLLNLFRNERNMLQEKGTIAHRDIVPLLEQKKRILDHADQHRAELRGTLKEARPDPAKVRHLHQELRELIEQLLVIERENDLLLRRCLPSR